MHPIYDGSSSSSSNDNGVCALDTTGWHPTCMSFAFMRRDSRVATVDRHARKMARMTR